MDSRVISALGDFESRLRRVLGLVGEVGAQFTPSMTSVLIAGDLAGPGNTEYKGKRFSYGQLVTVAGIGRVGLRAIDSIVIERLVIDCFMASNGSVTVRKSVGAQIGTYPTRAVGWRDRMVSDTDIAPVETTATLQADSTQGVELLVNTVNTASSRAPIELHNIFLAAGNQLYVRPSQACTVFSWSFEGYVY